MTPELVVGIVALCVSVIGSAIGSAWWLGRELGEIKTRLSVSDVRFTSGAIAIDEVNQRVDKHDRRLDDHGERIVRLETKKE